MAKGGSRKQPNSARREVGAKRSGNVAGIDPGLTGAIGIVGEETAVYDMPILRVHSKGYVDGFELRRILEKHNPRLIVVEIQGVRPLQGISSAGQIMMVYGGIVSTALALGIPLELEVPAKWKRAFGLIGNVKDASRQKALRRFPKMAKELKRKKDHNRAEALLIASYGKTLH